MSNDNPIDEAQPPQDTGESNNSPILQAGCFLVTLSPFIAFIGAIRWNITRQLDADLATIAAVFCDSVLLFLLLLPLAESGAKSRVVSRLLIMATTKLTFLIGLFFCAAAVVFVLGAIAAFHYLINLLFEALFRRA